ncbi:hypothetical protein [Nocardia pseudovaccinii]|uniref:hypothetical protein n=1 Tax=Nocardia pseudovaccinii TaxID=189540 RepID=UPI0007A3EDC3|nr:hypothetical protein [Nocardia pseudovaccinii]
MAVWVTAAEAGAVTVDTIAEPLDPARFDVDAALDQFSVAGLRTFAVDHDRTGLTSTTRVRHCL